MIPVDAGPTSANRSPGGAVTVTPRLREPLVTFLATTAAAAALYWTAKVVPPLHSNLHAAIAILFFYAPVLAGRLAGRPFDFREAGLKIGRASCRERV